MVIRKFNKNSPIPYAAWKTVGENKQNQQKVLNICLEEEAKEVQIQPLHQSQ